MAISTWLERVRQVRLPKLNYFWKVALPVLAVVLIAIVSILSISLHDPPATPWTPSTEPWDGRIELGGHHYGTYKGTPATTSDRFVTAWRHWYNHNYDIRSRLKFDVFKMGEGNDTVFTAMKLNFMAEDHDRSIWELQEYQRNSTAHPVVPLSLDVHKAAAGTRELRLLYRAPESRQPDVLWSNRLEDMTPDDRRHLGIGLATGKDGWVQLFWEGEAQQLGRGGAAKFPIVTFAEHDRYPESGPYRGEIVMINVLPWDFAWNRTLDGIKEVARISG